MRCQCTMADLTKANWWTNFYMITSGLLLATTALFAGLFGSYYDTCCNK